MVRKKEEVKKKCCWEFLVELLNLTEEISTEQLLPRLLFWLHI